MVRKDIYVKMLEDIIVAALHQANENVQEEIKTEINNIENYYT